MKLTYFTVENYRSITTAYKIDMHDVTIFVGKNNEGKSNLIKALVLSMEVLQKMSNVKMRKIPVRMYNWVDDYPVVLQNKNIKDKCTSFRLDFKLSQNEIDEFNNEIGSYINGDLSIYIKIKEDATLLISAPKKGKNAKALTRKIILICKFICDHFNLQYIPAIRSEKSAYNTISMIVEDELNQTEDENYKKAVRYIEGFV